MLLDRRRFMQGLAGSCLAAGGGFTRAEAQSSGSLPSPGASGIENIVVVTMENRSFDHFFGWLPNANGIPAGLSYPDASGVQHPVYSLAPDYTGCGHPDPDHSYSGSRICYAGGAMNGFLLDSSNDVFCIGYYNAADIPFYSALAQNYTACDNWHAAILGPTFSNRMFIWAAQTDRLTDSINFTSLPTIFDSLSQAGISHRYYFNNVPYLALWGFKYIFDTAFFSDFLNDAASGNLPAISFVDPIYTVLDDGTGNDDHPHADIRNGDAFLSTVYRALATGPKWANTVLIIIFDEWGGFFEHVAPPRVISPAGSPDTDLVNGKALLGFRIPAVIASPFSKNVNVVDHNLYDHTAALKLIEWRFGLQPLTARDASSDINNPAVTFNFNSPDPTLPALPQPAPVFAPPCFEGGIFDAKTGLTSAKPGTTSLGTRANEWTTFAQSEAAREFMNHPHIQTMLKNRN